MSKKEQKELNPPTTVVGKIAAGFLNWLERRIENWSKVGNPPVYDNSVFPWAQEIEREWHLIREELEAVMQRKDELPNFHEITSEVETITTDNHWKTFFFYGYGVKAEGNCERCPNTTRLVEKIPGMKTAMFSILSPGKHIPAHRGPYNGVLRYHLGLIVPEPNEKVRIRIADGIHHWGEGKGLIFDDSFDHEVWNDTDGTRVVLFVDFVRPIRWPFNWVNWLVLNLSVFTPHLREASQNQKEWEKKFYNKADSVGDKK